MKITFLGATKTVTGSNFLVEGAGKKFLVDCGMYQGKAQDEWENSAPFAFNPEEIDFMLLTHAHIDHSGRIPKLYNEGFRNKIYTTKATRDLCEIMLPDSGHIQEMEVEWKNRKRQRKGLPPIPPLYTAEQAMQCMEVFETVKYDEIVDIDENIHVRFNDAGHMLGSAIIEIWIDEDEKTTKIVFTGDLGNNDIPLLSSPTMIDSADYLVMESTYGGRLHNRNDDKTKIFLKVVSETLEDNGTVIIPSFAVGRTQEILYELNNIKENNKDPEFKKQYEELMNATVYVDSPLAISATEVFKKNMDLFNEETQELIKRGDNPLEFPNLKFTQTAEESKALNENSAGSIIISASGMCEIGRIKHHLKHNLWNPKSTILFVGYQAAGTLGSRIVNGEKSVKIFGEEVAVNARIEYIEGYSGHADQEWLLNFIYSFRTNKPKTIFLVHGEPEGQLILESKIKESTKIPVIIPEFGEEYTIDKKVRFTGRTKEAAKYDEEATKVEILNRISKLRNELDDMSKLVKEEVINTDVPKKEVAKINLRMKDLEQKILEIVEEIDK